MSKTSILFSLMILSIIVAPLSANPSAMALTTGPTPIPSSLFPAVNPSSPPVIPSSSAPSTALPISQQPTPYVVKQTQSGLVVSDSLTNESMTKDQLLANQQFWHYGGSATVVNAPYDIYKDMQGIHIGVQATADGAWAGYYAVAPSSNAVLYHAIVTTPVQTIPGDFYENGLYVQTANGNVTYVTCTSDTSSAGTVWAVFSAVGGTGGAQTFTPLWVDTSPNQPLTRDCTIITNGDNYLKVYLDGTMVYSSNTLNLQMPGPFIAFLEPQTSYPGQMLYGTYKDYYSTAGETIKVTNNPLLAATAKIVDPAGNIIATAPVVSGTATLDVGKFHMPLVANIEVFDSNNIEIGSTSSPVNIFGGSTYSVSLLV